MADYRKHEAQEWAWGFLKDQWTTIMTPFTPDNRVDEEGLQRNMRYIQSLGTRGGGCTWGMGEFWSLTFEERTRVMDVVAEEAAGRWGIAAHVTHTSVKDMLALADRAEADGFDLLVVAPPYMVAKTEEVVYDYVKTLADHTNMAIMFYNSPQFGIVMSPQGLKRLCQIPNVVGVKEASFNQQTSIETHLMIGKQSIISTPDEWIYPKAKELGFHQQVMFANTSDWRFDTPECNNYVQFINRASKGDLDLDFYAEHLKDLKALSDKWWGGTVQKSGGVLPAPMCKYWGELMGMAGGHVRAPLMPLTEEQKAELKRELMPLIPRPQTAKAPAQARTHAPWLNESIGSGAEGSGMMLLVSVQDMPEALEADRGGADIIDVKNLQEALVGSGHPNLVEEVRRRIPAHKHVSVTLGVVPDQAGTVAMAVKAAGMLDATSVKVGFCEATYESAVAILQGAREALRGYDTKLIGSLFADNHLFKGGLDPDLMVKLAIEGQCDGFLIDTLTKDGRNLFDFILESRLREMVMEAKQAGLSTALSGHLKLDNLDELARVNPDIVGVRGAVCSSGERDRAVAWEAVAHFKEQLDLRKSGQIDVRRQPVSGNGHSNGNGHHDGWAVVDGRGKNCAGVIAALSRQMDDDRGSFVEAILHDALNIYDVIYWAEQAGHKLLTQRKEDDGTLRVLIQPFGSK
ncbi:MAG: dihydrodipicolinate synthase family protein [Chloroflexi bacterium]|nr:dihydrodipicolinate synthase family protein [Chloroflexota bacterium]